MTAEFRPVPFGMIFYKLAEAFHWPPSVVGELTLDQVQLYTTEGRGYATRKMTPQEVAEHFAGVEAERAGGPGR